MKEMRVAMARVNECEENKKAASWSADYELAVLLDHEVATTVTFFLRLFFLKTRGCTSVA